jgi:biotin carboxyl carrier protein
MADLHVSLRRARGPVDDLRSASSPNDDQASEAETSVPATWHLLRSPLTGIWYDSSAPGAAPYVTVGDSVVVGMTVGLIETMKVFNEVAAEESGVVRQVFVSRGVLVMAHDPLLAIEPATQAATDVDFA